jgi:hypothetical protein
MHMVPVFIRSTGILINTCIEIEKIPKNTIFQNPIQNNSFSENFTWVEAVRKNPPAALFIFGPYFSPMALYARAPS